jgi:hypothetical protein
MMLNDKPAILGLLKDCFSKATDGDGQLVWDDVKGYALADAERAIKEHRREKGAQAWRPDINRIRSLAAMYHNNRARDNFRQTRVVDDIRRAFPQGTHNVPDCVVIVNYFASAWLELQQSGATEHGRESVRALIMNHCRNALTQVGIIPTDADEQAREVVELAPGEKIVKRSIFKPIPEPQEKWEAVKALSAVENVPAGSIVRTTDCI